jgi:hypothetical protein
MRVTIDAELKQDCYLDGLGSAPSELTNPGVRVSYINEISLGDRMQSYCMRLVLLDLEQYPGVENYYRTEDLVQSLIDERGAVTRVYCRYRLAWERMVPRCEHEGNCRGCYGLGDGSLVRDGYVGAGEVEYGLENGYEPRDYRGSFWGIHCPRERIRSIEIQRQLGLMRRQWAINRSQEERRSAMTRLGDAHPWSAAQVAAAWSAPFPSARGANEQEVSEDEAKDDGMPSLVDTAREADLDRRRRYQRVMGTATYFSRIPSQPLRRSSRLRTRGSSLGEESKQDLQ